MQRSWHGFLVILLASALLVQNLALAAVPSPSVGDDSAINLKTDIPRLWPSIDLVKRRPTRELKSTGVQLFKTEPNFEQLNFEILNSTEDHSRLAPGFIFLTIQGPYEQKHGPAIYDTVGNLIWFRDVASQDFHVCDYLGERGKHLCTHNWPDRRKEVFDQSYRIVTTIRSDDTHEFNVLPGGYTFLTAGDEHKKFDLTPYTGSRDGWVEDPHLYEYDMKSHNFLFKWNYLEYLPIWATHLWLKLDTPLGKINATRASLAAGKGTDEKGWDIGHANSVDKADGDYFLSLRHMDQIIKIAGPQNLHGVTPGSVLWRLGGTGSDIELQNFNFTRQHHVRVHSVDANYTVLSLFNNGWEGSNTPSVKESSGQLIGVNNETMQAELIQVYPHPSGAISGTRGSTEVLPNGNILNGFGRFPDIIEYDRNGTILYHARFTRFTQEKHFRWRKNEYSYRVFKTPWIGLPAAPPKAVAYARSCTIEKQSSPLTVYASWNGATEVASWRVSLGTTPNGPWIPAGLFPKVGFETSMNCDLAPSKNIEPSGDSVTTPPHYVRVEGLGSDQTVLGSTTVNLWVPRNRKLWSCDKLGCNSPTPFVYSKWKSIDCSSPYAEPMHVAVVVFFLQVASFMYTAIWWALCSLIGSRSHDGVYQEVPVTNLDNNEGSRTVGLEAIANKEVLGDERSEDDTSDGYSTRP